MTAYFGGVALDPRVLIARFQQLVNMLPNEPVKGFGYKKKLSKAKGTGDQSFEKARKKLIESSKDPKLVDIYLKSKEPLDHSKKLFKINKGINHDEKALIKDFDAFKKRYIEESTPEKEIMPDKPIKFEKPITASKKPLTEIQKQIEQLEKQQEDILKKEAAKNEIDEFLGDVLKEAMQKQAHESAAESILHQVQNVQPIVEVGDQSKLKFQKIRNFHKMVAKEFNIKSKDKLPVGLEEEFLAAADDPEQEKAVVKRYEDELTQIKVKNDQDDLVGKKKKLLTEAKITKQFGKLTQKALKLKMKVAEAAKKAIKLATVPETIKNELIASTKGKVMLPGPERGKKSKKETIVVKV